MGTYKNASCKPGIHTSMSLDLNHASFPYRPDLQNQNATVFVGANSVFPDIIWIIQETQFTPSSTKLYRFTIP
jgi:hypothetical protein